MVALWGAVLTTAAMTAVVPGTGNIKSAISAANDGDTLVLQTGTYVESGSISIAKHVCIVAGEDQTPVVNTGSYFDLVSGGLVLRGITFDANKTGEYFINVHGNAAMNIVLDGCEICGYPKYQHVVSC